MKLDVFIIDIMRRHYYEENTDVRLSKQWFQLGRDRAYTGEVWSKSVGRTMCNLCRV